MEGHLPRMKRKRSQILILLMDFTHNIIQRRLTTPIRNRMLRHIRDLANTPQTTTDRHEFRRLSLLHQRFGGLEEEEGAEGVGMVVVEHFGDGEDAGEECVTRDSGIGDYDVEVRYVVRGGGEDGDCGLVVGFRGAV